MPTIASCVCIVPIAPTSFTVHPGALITIAPDVGIVTIAVWRTHIWPVATSAHLEHQQPQLECTSHLLIETSTPTSIAPDTHAMIRIDMPRLSRQRRIPQTPGEFHYLL